MFRQRRFGLVRLAIVASFVFSIAVSAPRVLLAQAADLAAAAKASPDLVGALSKEIGGTPEQSAGAAGALFNVARSRLKPEEFSQVAAAVPGMDSLLSAAAVGGAGGGAG